MWKVPGVSSLCVRVTDGVTSLCLGHSDGLLLLALLDGVLLFLGRRS